ncbi:MAG: ABC transporter permease [Planctomycetes bacterium]|nr:ABC transporter permease [Planctomycetota bacterium]
MRIPALLRPPTIEWPAAFAVWRRDVTVYRRTWKLNILPNFFEPVFYLLAMGFGLAGYVRPIEGLPYLDFIAPGLIATQAMMGASFEVTYNCFVKLTFGKTYDAIMATPVNIEEIAVGEMLWAITRAMTYAVIFFVVLWGFGLIHTPLALLAIPVAFLTGALFAGIGLSFTALVPAIDFFTFYYTLFISPMYLFSGIFFPVAEMPGWAQAISWCMPLTHAVAVLQALFRARCDLATAGHMACLLGLTVLFGLLAVNLLRRRLVE